MPTVMRSDKLSWTVLCDKYGHHPSSLTNIDIVQQNIAEIDEIPWTEKTVEVVLPAAERAIYLELEHHLRALDMTIKRGRKTESDREKRLAKSLGESRSVTCPADAHSRISH
jgi:hypothetical protein